MNKIIQFVLILAVGLILYFLLNRMMQKLMVELSEILYKEVNPEKYLEVLNSWKGKMFFSKKTRSLMAIDALLMQNETAKIEEIFEQLDAVKMNPALLEHTQSGSGYNFASSIFFGSGQKDRFCCGKYQLYSIFCNPGRNGWSE